MRRSRSIAALGAACLTIAWSTTGLPVAGESSGPSTSESPGPGVLDLTPEQIDAMSDEVLAADLERFGVTGFDPDLPQILSELRKIAGQELADILADQEQPVVPGLARSGDLVASIAGPVAPIARGTHDQGGMLLGVLGNMVVEVGRYIEEAKPGPGAGVIEPAVYERSSTTTVGGRSVGTHQRVKVRQALDHSTVSLSREMSETYAIPGPDGQLKATVKDSATVRVRIDVCPNEQGVVKGRVDTLSETTFTGISGPDYHALYIGSDDLSVQVTDTAQVGPVQHTQEARRQATGHRPAFGSEPAKDTNVTLGVKSTHSTSPGSPSADTYTLTADQGADRADLRIATFVTGLTQQVADEALAAASTVWKRGRCLKVIADPANVDVEPGSQTPIHATIRHIVEETEVKRKERANLSGPGSVAPSDTPFDAPGPVTYQAPTSEGRATITFRTVSNRGIAQVAAAYHTKERACPDEARLGIAEAADVAMLPGVPLVAQADGGCPATLVLQGTITGSYTNEGPGTERSEASIEVTLTLSWDDAQGRWNDWTTSGIGQLDSEVTGDCQFSFHETMPFAYAYRDSTSGVWSGNMFVAAQPEWGLLPKERQLLELPLYVEVAGTGDGTCKGNPWQAGVGVGHCEELVVTTAGDGAWHGECDERMSDTAEGSWVVNLQQQ